MLLKDRVMLITNVEKFAGHGTTAVALAQGATVLAHDPSFEAPSARRKYETQFQGAHALSAIDPATMVELALKRHGRIDALVNNDAYPALRTARRSAHGGFRQPSRQWR
jgi:3-oxoacyl-[acyl-carrier protein] reductase